MSRIRYLLDENKETAALPNAPFMATYDKSPSFTQLQILVAFVNAHANRPGGMPPGRKPCRLEPFLLNLFSGRDATALGASEPKLAADLFLRCLHQAALHRLVEREMGEGTVFFNWLRLFYRTSTGLAGFPAYCPVTSHAGRNTL